MRKYWPTFSVVKLFLFVGLSWAALVGPFSSVIILEYMGVPSSQIGMFTAFCSLLMMVVQPVWGYISDKIGSPRKVLCLCMGLSAVFFGCILFTSNPYIAMCFMVIDVLFRCGIVSLLDSHTLAEMNVTPGLQYGYIRMAGSVFFGLMSFVYSGVIKANDDNALAIIPISLVIAAAAIFWGLFVARGRSEVNQDRKASTKKAKANLKKDALALIHDKKYLLFITFVAFYSLSMSPLFVFIIKYVADVGASPGDVPLIHTFRCVIELPMFILVGILSHRLGAKRLMLGGVLFSFVYLVGLYAAHTYNGLVVSHMLGAVGFILCLTGRMRYINENTPESVRSTSIAVMGACEVGLGSIVGNLMAGFVLEHFAGTRVLTLASAAALCVALALLAVLGRKAKGGISPFPA